MTPDTAPAPGTSPLTTVEAIIGSLLAGILSAVAMSIPPLHGSPILTAGILSALSAGAMTVWVRYT